MSNKLIKVTGVWTCSASLHEKTIAQKTVKWCIKRLGLSRLKKLNIDVKIKNLDHDDCYGYCEEIDHKNRLYKIVVSNDQSLRDFIMTIIHEMIHIKQYVRNKWSGDGEKEAWNTQERLTDELWKEDIL